MKILKNNFWFIITIVVVVIFNFVLANQIEKTTPENASHMLKEKTAVVVDVREVHEQKEGRIKDAISIPMSVMDSNTPEFEKMISSLPKDKKIILYCRSGRRSGMVGSTLEKKGFQVLNLGGFDAWKSQGLPVD